MVVGAIPAWRYARAMGFGELDREDLVETMRYYYAQVEWGVDRPLGRLLGALEAKGLAENTIVVMTADHGDFMGDCGMVRKGMFLYDALLHVPLLWWAPGRIPAAARTDALAQSADLFPTLAELTGGKRPEDASGISVAESVLGAAQDRPALFTSSDYGDLARDVLPRHTQALRPSMRPTHRTKMVRTHE